MRLKLSKCVGACFILISITVIFRTLPSKKFPFGPNFTVLQIGVNDTQDYFHQESGLQPESDLVYRPTALDEQCAKEFLEEFQAYCYHSLKPKSSNIKYTRFLLPDASVNYTAMCPCLSGKLVGLYIPVMDPPSMTDMIQQFKDVDLGGRWSPSWCAARHRIAIIVPFSNRENQLQVFLYHFHTMLQMQLVDYNIYVIHQVEPEVFNRAALMNVGFTEAEAAGDYDCFIFHDVDQYPIDDRNMYVCSSEIRHLVAFREKLNYTVAYTDHFGGGNAFSSQQFRKINGFSNKFYGWGGEDDDLSQRVTAKQLRRVRYPSCVAKYNSVKHEKQSIQSDQKSNGYEFQADFDTKDGLTTLKYTLLSTKQHELYTKISVSLPSP